MDFIGAGPVVIDGRVHGHSSEGVVENMRKLYMGRNAKNVMIHDIIWRIIGKRSFVRYVERCHAKKLKNAKQGIRIWKRIMRNRCARDAGISRGLALRWASRMMRTLYYE